MYPHDVEPWEKNITTLVDFHGKWENMIKKGTPIPTPIVTAAEQPNVKKDKKAGRTDEDDAVDDVSHAIDVLLHVQ